MTSDLLRSAALAAAAVLAAAGAAADDAAKPWREKYFNPNPDDGDLVLPMPCGGAMTFRPVAVPAPALLGDRRVTLGGTDERFAFAEHGRPGYVAGVFAAGDAGRALYMGKYELTRDQRAALSGNGECPRARSAGRLPAAGLTWPEAVALADRYSRWLYENARDRLPRDDGQLAYARLPTEAEWEYAARGGSAVSDAAFTSPRYPMSGALEAYEWFGSQSSSGFEAQAVGLLEPNPLGLHDMLGNVSELVLDPYRLNKVNRLHGRTGGWMARGGHFFTPPDQLRSAHREEIAPFGGEGVTRLPTVGLRLVLAAPVLSSIKRVAALKAAWPELSRTLEPLAATERADDPVEELDTLIGAAGDGALKERLEGLRNVVRANVATSNAQADRAARGLLRLGAVLGSTIKTDHRTYEAKRRFFETVRANPDADATRVAGLERNLTREKSRLDFNVDYYLATARELTETYPAAVVLGQFSVLEQELEAREQHVLKPFARLFREHAGSLEERALERAAVVEAVTAVELPGP